MPTGIYLEVESNYSSVLTVIATPKPPHTVHLSGVAVLCLP